MPYREHGPVQEINPWEVKGDADGKIDYEKLQKKVYCRTLFGCKIYAMKHELPRQ
jgi:hypothetical protein